MTTLTSNLGLLLQGNMVENPIKAVSLKPVTIKSYANTAKQQLVIDKWLELQTDIFKFFKAGKGSATMEDLIYQFEDQIQYLNDNVKLEDIRYILDGDKIRACYGSLRIAQLSTKNKKLKPDEKGQGFLLWSVLGHITCNGKTKLCAGYCYNNCKEFDTHLIYKIDNLISSLLGSFDKIIEKMLILSPHKKTFVRIHEDGDFYNSEYFEKWQKIIKENKHLDFEAYTKEPSLLEKVNDVNANIENFVLRYSVMEDTDMNTVEYIKENNVHNYIALGVKKKDKNAEKTFEFVAPVNRCLDSCQHCKKCYTKKVVSIFTKIH